MALVGPAERLVLIELADLCGSLESWAPLGKPLEPVAPKERCGWCFCLSCMWRKQSVPASVLCGWCLLLPVA